MQIHFSSRLLKPIIFLMLVLCSISQIGCSLFSDSETIPNQPERTSEETSEAERPDPGPTGIEVTWQVPAERVDGFILRYGYSKTEMSTEKRISSSDVSVERDAYFGPVYRYILEGIDESRPLFVAIAAFKGDKLSEFSPILQESSPR